MSFVKKDRVVSFEGGIDIPVTDGLSSEWTKRMKGTPEEVDRYKTYLMNQTELFDMLSDMMEAFYLQEKQYLKDTKDLEHLAAMSAYERIHSIIPRPKG